MTEPETAAFVLKGVGDMENGMVLALHALKNGRRVVVTADHDGEKSHVFTAVRKGSTFQIISIKGRGLHRTEDKAITAGMSVALNFFTWQKSS